MIKPVNIDKGRFRKYGKQYSDGFHIGYDFDCPENTEVKAVKYGIVINSTGLHNGYGSLNPSTKGGVIFIQHDNQIAQYGHVNIKVNVGDEVKEGQVIGTVAGFKNRNDYLPHLHFGVWDGLDLPKGSWGYVKNESEKGKWIDPIEWLNKE